MADARSTGGVPMSRRWRRAAVSLLAAMAATMAIVANAAPDLRDLAFQQRLGHRLPGDVWLQDQQGTRLRLSQALQGKPLILQLGYFRCPNLCGVVRADLLHAVGQSGLVAGRDYTFLSLSIDPTETRSDAASAKSSDALSFPVAGPQQNLRYATASAEAIRQIASAVGFNDRPDPRRKQFAHPAGVIFVTGSGVVSGYLLGVGYRSSELRAAVKRADTNSIAAAALPVVLLCYDYDPTTGRYSLAIMKVLRLVAALTALTVGVLLFLAFRREGRAA